MHHFTHLIKFIKVRYYLDGVQGQLYHSALLRGERFGLLTNHVLLKTTTIEAQTTVISLSIHKPLYILSRQLEC